MKYLLKCRLWVGLLLIPFSAALATTPPVRFENGQAVFVLKDQLRHPFYWWPRTLLNYPVQFDQPVDAKDFSLVEKESEKTVPFQFSDFRKTPDGKTLTTLSVLSDLPSGGTRTFVLTPGNSTPSAISLSETKEGETILIRTDKLSVRIPASLPASGPVPGPVMQLFQAGKSAMGKSELVTKTKKVQKIETEQLSAGPLFVTYRITYRFASGASYKATVKCIQGYDFLEIREEMTGLQPEDNVHWRLDWTQFQPTHRQAPNHPFGRPGTVTTAGASPQQQTYSASPGFGRFNWETIDQTKLNYHHGIMPDGEVGKIPFEIGMFEPWPAERTVTSTLFWDEKTGQSVGVFANDLSGWNDSDYSIWHSSRILNIRFFYRNKLLSWEFPVSEGSRSVALSCYPHQQDIAYMNELETKNQPQQHPFGFTYKAEISQLSYNAFLQNRYGTIHLDKIKNWQLTYPDSLPAAPVLFQEGKLNTRADFIRDFLGNYYVSELPFSGTRQNSGYGPVPARQFFEKWIDALNRFYPALNPDEKARVTAMFLFHTYVAADEEYMPMRYMLSGHPNFLADVKSIPAMTAYQFPNHPEAANWADLFEKYVDLNTHYHTRPTVKTWGAQGGRWTENLGTYVWGFFRSTIRASFLLNQSQPGKNRLAGPQVSAIGNWILNALSAPYNGESLDFYRNPNGSLDYHFWGIVTKPEGPRRIHPPQGAHAARRKAPSSLWMLGNLLNHYDPLLAEHLRYVAKPTDDDQEAFYASHEAFQQVMYPKGRYDRGTKPDFKSIKLTGYGTILRAGVDTPEELSVHLSQIDEGPNYRWGVPAQGGTGGIYFYAGGKSYSHNGREDVGDRKVQDTDLMTNFGVFKDGHFKSIGMNGLHRPLYNLGIGQFTEITSSEKSSYAWPDYQSRSIMLVDKDYFITYDDVYNNNIGGRFSWFTHPDEDLPTLEIVRVGTGRDKLNKTQVTGAESKGVWFDGLGDFTVFVSHKKGFALEPTAYGCRVKTPANQVDYIFRNDNPVDFQEDQWRFSGTAGFIRVQPDGRQELVLFHGQRIGNGTLTLTVSDTDAGLSASVKPKGWVDGTFFSPRPATVSVQWNGDLAPGLALYIDGKKQPLEWKAGGFSIPFPAGQHSWQLTAGQPVPVRSAIQSSENDHGKTAVFFTPSAGAAGYRIEISRDNGDSWQTLGETAKTAFTVLKPDTLAKAHVRVIALNRDHQSEPSPAYPVYFIAQKPHFPDGLKADLATGNLNWGQVLGCTTYQLYRRLAGTSKFQVVYTGPNSTFHDPALTGKLVYEYAVSAINKNGESRLSDPLTTNPDSWLHWNPKPGEPFRRTNTQRADSEAVYYPK
ncbi:fibronectin type III domain-containing protein [Larkinella terrae]|uniref:Fibronectin type-III domain-containing protein n=1 Tax=Larkinella terrae TaxID=2025311 RepID=A0A7K0EFD7_9BACT|nr:fibronectin type III domain-containing protein [Larkinella terrae]MRS60412.1 hypothetical protein [Larkinella terrae]